MTDNTTDFFDGIGEGTGAPSAQLANVGDFVHGEIVAMFKRDYIPYENRKTKEPARKSDGSVVQQLVIVLQTDLRNWANVSKVPKVDPNDENSPEKPASDDDGKRAIYVPEGKNIQFAIGRAVAATKKPFEVGGKLGVRIAKLTDTGKGNPLKEHEAKYEAKPAESAGDGFFGEQPAQATPAQQQAPAQSAPAQSAPPAQTAPAVSQDPWATPAPAAQQSAPASQDPWGSPAGAGAGNDEPPF